MSDPDRHLYLLYFLSPYQLDMQLFYHGHAFIEIESDHGIILIDPFITGNSLCDIKSTDYYHDKSVIAVILTHGHADHIGDTLAITALHPQAQVISTVWVITRLISQGMTNPHHKPSIWWMVNLEHFAVKMTPAEHDGSVMNSEIYSQPAGVIVTINGKKIYHAGDTWLTMDLKLIKDRWPIDVAFLPIGDYYTMWVADAVTACGWIMPQTVVPIHYNTFPLIKSDPMEFSRQVMMHKFAVPKMLLPGQYVVI